MPRTSKSSSVSIKYRSISAWFVQGKRWPCKPATTSAPGSRTGCSPATGRHLQPSTMGSSDTGSARRRGSRPPVEEPHLCFAKIVCLVPTLFRRLRDGSRTRFGGSQPPSGRSQPRIRAWHRPDTGIIALHSIESRRSAPLPRSSHRCAAQCIDCSLGWTRMHCYNKIVRRASIAPTIALH